MFVDWISSYWPQILDPFGMTPGVYNLPWLFVLLQPLRLLSLYPACILIQIVSIFVVIKLCKKNNLSTWRMIMVVSSAPMIWNTILGQVDGLLLFAYLVGPFLSTFVFLCKPQLLIAYIIYPIRQKPITMVAVIFFMITAWIVWRWPFSIQDMHNLSNSILSIIPPLFTSGWNWSLWPWSLILLPLLFLKVNKYELGMAVSPFLFPYAGLQSLIGPMIIAAKKLPWWGLIITWILLWSRWIWMWNAFSPF